MLYKTGTSDLETVVSSTDFEKVHRFYRGLKEKGMNAFFTSEPEYHDAEIKINDTEVMIEDYWNSWIGFEIYLIKETNEKRVMIRFADEDHSGVDIPYVRFVEVLEIIKEY